LRQLLRRAAASALQAAGAPLGRLRGKVCILAYHRVLREDEVARAPVQPGMYVSEAVFDRQVGFLSAHFDILSFADLLRMWAEHGGDRRARYCVITFDDGWRDNYLNALPILSDHRAPATVFLTTSLIGTDRWFWPERLARLLSDWGARGRPPAAPGAAGPAEQAVFAEIEQLLRSGRPGTVQAIDRAVERLKQYPEDLLAEVLSRFEAVPGWLRDERRALLDWDEVRTMSRQGVSFGSHGSSHRILTRLRPEEVREELRGSWARLREPGVVAVPVLAYPNGNWSQQVAAQAAEAGYEAAVTTTFGHEALAPGCRFALRRVGVHNDVTATVPMFATRIAGMLRR
jgi:peptidoglycan/xylan/chitin deacetylase (PgdA/CDA1 family)